MIDLEKFRWQWKNTLQVPNGYTLVDVAPLECHIGYSRELCKSLMIIGGYRAKNLTSSNTVKILQGKRNDARFQLELILLDENLDEVFIRMCHDLLRYSENVADEKSAIKNFELRYGQWQSLFASGKTGLLTTQEQHGLIGELLFLREQVEKRPLDEAVMGWYGPLNEHQDFSYSEGWYEIKTVMNQAEKVQIASLEQLSRLDAGELIIYRLAKTAGSADDFDLNKFTLNSLVKDLIKLFSADISSVQKFEELLFRVGYIEREEYDEQIYKLLERMDFEVNDKFPRLVREKLPPEILSANYALSITGLKNLKGD